MKSVPRYRKRVGKCYYCGEVVYDYQVARVEDPSTQTFIGSTLERRAIRRLAHSLVSGYECEGILRHRFTGGIEK